MDLEKKAREMGQLEDALNECFSAVSELENQADYLWEAMAGKEPANDCGTEIESEPIVAVRVDRIKGRIMQTTNSLGMLREAVKGQLGDMRLIERPILPKVAQDCDKPVRR